MTRPDEDETYWFKPKRFGYGATPTTWQGWALILGVVVLAIAIVRLVRSNPIRLGLLVPLFAGFIALTARKTDGSWRWRWGSRD
jgi:hypothetical protein